MTKKAKKEQKLLDTPENQGYVKDLRCGETKKGGNKMPEILKREIHRKIKWYEYQLECFESDFREASNTNNNLGVSYMSAKITSTRDFIHHLQDLLGAIL